MANSWTPVELKNCKLENSSLIFSPLANISEATLVSLMNSCPNLYFLMLTILLECYFFQLQVAFKKGLLKGLVYESAPEEKEIYNKVSLFCYTSLIH